jgi:hypothetical protein
MGLGTQPLSSLIYAYLGFFFLDPEDVNQSRRAIWKYGKGTGDHVAKTACFKV